MISRNESKTLPKLVGSVKHFLDAGGEIIIVDTGSTDNTAQVARDLGCTVVEVGDRFRHTLTEQEANAINKEFVIAGDEPVVKAGDSFFLFDEARNFASSLSKTDWVFSPDCDEYLENFDLAKIEEAISDPNTDRLEYEFVFASNPDGTPNISFRHSKFFRKSKMKWVRHTHEVLSNLVGVAGGNTRYIPIETCYLRHAQNHSTDRTGYIRGLIYDLYKNKDLQDADRSYHYTSRELFYTRRFRSAIALFKKHIAMDKWAAEKGQSWIYIGDCHLALNERNEALAAYMNGYACEGRRREALIRLSSLFQSENNHQASLAMAQAALSIPGPSGFYSDKTDEYRDIPHHLAYVALYWLGRKPEAKEHWEKCLQYAPDNIKYQKDGQFFIDLPVVQVIIPTLGRPEGLKRCLDSIEKLNYPKDKIRVAVLDGEGTVPWKVKKMVDENPIDRNDFYCFMANDTEFTPDSLLLAVVHAFYNNIDLVAFNTGPLIPDKGNECEHFIIRNRGRDYLEDKEIFHTSFHHVGCDNYLKAQMIRKATFSRCESAIVNHYHFSRPKGNEYDEVYQKGWSKAEQDRANLADRLAKLKN